MVFDGMSVQSPFLIVDSESIVLKASQQQHSHGCWVLMAVLLRGRRRVGGEGEGEA